MQPLVKFFNDYRSPRWALIGKGPSCDRRPPTCEMPTLGLNHVCRFAECDLTHFTDLDAYLECADVLAQQHESVVLPWFPHVRNKPGKKSISELVSEISSLERLHMQGRLFTYNSTLAKKRKESLSTHTVRYFSAVVGLHILAYHGIKTVLTLGIDGGTKYASMFDQKTLLSNGRPSFDVQFGEMKKIADKFGVTVTPMVPDGQEAPAGK